MLETIVALATPPLRSALAIVRFSGEDCFNVVSKFFSKDLTSYTKNSIIHGFIKDNDEVVDEVVLLLYKSPRSFTGEDSIEIITHGSPLIFNKVIKLALENGARMATPGEYSNRAYMNGKLDLIQAESINDLINAETDESKKISMNALLGETSKLIYPLKQEIGDLLSNIEANIDYSEYTDIIDLDNEKIVEICKVIVQKIDNLIKNGYKGKIIKDGINVAIIGKPNVGKSSLLNALVGENKAIVTDIKGTTRDIVEGKIENFDEEDNEILKLTQDKLTIRVFNKSDLNNYSNDKLYISALNKDISKLKNEILKVLGISKENYDNPSLANERDIGLLISCQNELNKVIELSSTTSIDLLVEHIKSAYLKILSITGEDYDFDMAKEIFSRFCLGK